MSHEIPPFRERLKSALADPNLEKALGRTLTAFKARRDAAFAELDFEGLRADLKARKTRAIGNLPELIARFKDAAEKVNCNVYLAKDAEEANRIIVEIARARDVKLAVKSKSMATEEIGLNGHLEAAGVRVVETDLGEWIIQLAGERPSHLIAPALHKTREQVAELFSKVLGQELPAEPAELVKVARRELRQAFINADLGISGANIAIADTGTIVIVTNEGNAELVTTLPPVHVVVCGIDKIVPSLDDATAVLKVLARSGTGQHFSSYVSFLTGPSRTADIELELTLGAHGPRERHIVLIDNGRSAMREDPAFEEALHCIRCGACANVCPAYRVVGGHAFGHIYTGPIGLVLTPFHHGLDAAGGPQSLCLSCNACEQVCPAGIPLARQILEVRQRYAEKQGLKRVKRTVLGTLADRARTDTLTGIARLFQAPWVHRRDGSAFVKPPFSDRLAGWRSLPAIPRQPLHQRNPAAAGGDIPVIPGSKAAGLKVAYFAGCITDRFYPEMGEAIVKVVKACGAEVSFPEQQNCCGLAANNSGDRALALKMAKQTIEVLERSAVHYILSGSTSCAAAIAQDYPYLFREEPEWQARAAVVGKKTIDFTRFVDGVAKLPAGALAGDERLAVTYHDSCQSCNALGIKAEPRRIIEGVLGHTVVEMAESAVCCGFGGSFSLDYPEVSRAILGRKLKNVKAAGVQAVVLDNPGCIMQLRGGLDAAGSPVQVLHLAELMAQSL